MGPPARIWKPTLDCSDIEVTQTFWCWLLGFEPTFAEETTRFLGLPGGRTELCIQQATSSASSPSALPRRHPVARGTTRRRVVRRHPGGA